VPPRIPPREEMIPGPRYSRAASEAGALRTGTSRHRRVASLVVGASLTALALCGLLFYATLRAAIPRVRLAAPGPPAPTFSPRSVPDIDDPPVAVEFSRAGLLVPLPVALSLDAPAFPSESNQIEDLVGWRGSAETGAASDRAGLRGSVVRAPVPRGPAQGDAVRGRRRGGAGRGPPRPSRPVPGPPADGGPDGPPRPQVLRYVASYGRLPGDVRPVVGVVSGCCDARSGARRAALRQTWVAQAAAEFPGVDVRFVLSQPARGAEDSALAALEAEVREHGDVVVLR